LATYLLITNPISSRGLGEKGIAEVTALFEARGARIDVHRTRGAGDARSVVADRHGAYDAVIAAGGDGTIGEVVNGLAGAPVPVGVLPRGTANVLAKELALPREMPDAADVILRGKTKKFDLGVADGKRFVLMASAGYDAQVVALAHESRGAKFGYTSYVAPILKALAAGDFPEIRVKADGREYACRHVIVANVENYGGPMRPARGAKHDDGLFDVVMYTRHGRLSVARYAFAAFLGRTASRSDVIRVQASKVTLSSERPVALQLDGDPAGSLPRTLEVLPAGMTVIVP